MFILHVRFRHQLLFKEIQFDDIEGDYSSNFIQYKIECYFESYKEKNTKYLICDSAGNKLPENKLIKSGTYLIINRVPSWYEENGQNSKS